MEEIKQNAVTVVFVKALVKRDVCVSVAVCCSIFLTTRGSCG